MTQIMVYTQPLLMYGLSMMSVYQPIKILWASLACLQVLDVFPIFSHFMSCFLVTCYFYVQEFGQQYEIKFGDRVFP